MMLGLCRNARGLLSPRSLRLLSSSPAPFPHALTSRVGGKETILGNKKPASIRKKLKINRGAGKDGAVKDKRLDPEFYNSMISKDVQVLQAMASAEAYNLAEVFKFLPKNSCEVIGNEVIRYSAGDKIWFIFKYGSFVGWGASEQDVRQLKSSLLPFEINSNPYQEFEQFDFVLDKDSDESIFLPQGDGLIVIGSAQPSHQLDQMAFSHGIANSVKLAILETELEVFITKIRDLPELLSSKYQYKFFTRLAFNRKDALNRLSSLLKFRAHLNLHSGLLETPDLYWDNSKLENHFSSISDELDIKSRVTTLNKKLDYAKDIAELLKDYLTEKHSLSLEWCIVVLITIEVIFGLPQFFREYNIDTSWWK